MLILSFDCANKSLGVALIKITDKFEILLLETTNLIEGKMLEETNSLERSIALKKYLEKFTDKYDFVLIEYQMNANDKSREISHFLVYHFNNFNVEFVDAGLKNKIHFNKIHMCDFYATYANAEYARKKHSIALAEYFCPIINNNIGTVNNGVRNNKTDDYADALMQILAFLDLKYIIDVNDIAVYKKIDSLTVKNKLIIKIPARKPAKSKPRNKPVFDLSY